MGPFNKVQLLSRMGSDLTQMSAYNETSVGRVVDAVQTSAGDTKVGGWFRGTNLPNLLDLHVLAVNAPAVAYKLATLAFERSSLCVTRGAECRKPGTLAEGLEQSLDAVVAAADLAREYGRDVADQHIDMAECSRLVGLIDRLIANLQNLRLLITTAAGKPAEPRMRIPG